MRQYGWETVQAKPKTEESEATVALDAGAVAVLAEHRMRQHEERRAAGERLRFGVRRTRWESVAAE
jgi:hypothetical protein